MSHLFPTLTHSQRANEGDHCSIKNTAVVVQACDITIQHPHQFLLCHAQCFQVNHLGIFDYIVQCAAENLCIVVGHAGSVFVWADRRELNVWHDVADIGLGDRWCSKFLTTNSMILFGNTKMDFMFNLPLWCHIRLLCCPALQWPSHQQCQLSWCSSARAETGQIHGHLDALCTAHSHDSTLWGVLIWFEFNKCERELISGYVWYFCVHIWRWMLGIFVNLLELFGHYRLDPIAK